MFFAFQLAYLSENPIVDAVARVLFARYKIIDEFGGVCLDSFNFIMSFTLKFLLAWGVCSLLMGFVNADSTIGGSVWALGLFMIWFTILSLTVKQIEIRDRRAMKGDLK